MLTPRRRGEVKVELANIEGTNDVNRGDLILSFILPKGTSLSERVMTLLHGYIDEGMRHFNYKNDGEFHQRLRRAG